MKKLVMIICITLFLPLRCITAYALPTERMEVDSFNIPVNAAYIDLLIFMNETDECYTQFNNDNMNQYSFDSKTLSDYNEDGYVSFSCHYNNIYTDMTLERINVNDEIIARNCLSLKKYPDGYFGQDLEAMNELLEKNRRFKIAVIDENGNIIQTSDSFEIINDSGAFQNAIRYDIADNQITLEWDEHPNELAYHIRKNRNVIAVIIVIVTISLCTLIFLFLKKKKK